MNLNSILKSFHKTLNKLDKFIEQTDQQIEENERLLTEINSNNFTHHQNLKKASYTRGQVAKLIGPDE